MEICKLYRKYLWQIPAHASETRLLFSYSVPHSVHLWLAGWLTFGRPRAKFSSCPWNKMEKLVALPTSQRRLREIFSAFRQDQSLRCLPGCILGGFRTCKAWNFARGQAPFEPPKRGETPLFRSPLWIILASRRREKVSLFEVFYVESPWQRTESWEG